MYGYMNVNEEGMPMMTAAELALEAALDEQSAAERFEDSWYDDEAEDDAPEHDDEDSEPWEDEDGWLDGSYEE